MNINVIWLYPDILNLHGDRGNMMALSKISAAMGINMNITKVHTAGEMPDFSDIDLIFMGAGQIRDVEHILKDMETYKDKLSSYIDAGGYLLAIGSTGCILGKSLTTDDGKVINGLGILDITAKELSRTKMPYVTKEVYGDDIWWKYKDMEILGCQIQRVDYTLGNLEISPLGKVIYGYGNNLQGEEGARYKNLLLTNTVGPLLSGNPWFGADLLSELAKSKNLEVSTDLANLEYLDYAQKAAELKKKFIQDKFKLPGIIHEGC